MDTAAMGRTQKQDGERGIDQQDIFYGVISFLTAITRFLFNRVLGADDTPLGAIMGKRGDAGAVVGPVAPSPGSSSGVTTVATAACETPKRCARAVRERVGASPRARNAARRAGSRT